jgi:hypothetical protein
MYTTITSKLQYIHEAFNKQLEILLQTLRNLKIIPTQQEQIKFMK